MHSYSTIDLGTPYHDPTSPLYHQSLHSSRIKNTITVKDTSRTTNSSTMTHTSQLSPQSSDYFSHKPRSFLSLHTDFDEKLASSPQTPDGNSGDRDRGRRQSRLVGYDQPILNGVPTPGPRVPRSRTLIRLLLLLSILGLVSVGWRCEAVGCKGRGGGALVGDYVGGGSVVAGWGTPEGMDLSAIWDRPSWGGERQGGEKEEGSSTLDTFRDEDGEALDGFRDEEGELVGFAGLNDDEEVEWDDEDGEFRVGEVDDGDGEQMGGEEPVPELGQQGEAVVEQDEVENELYEVPLVEDITGPVGEMTGPVNSAVEDAATDAVAQQDAVSEQSVAQQEDHQVSESASLAQKGSWLGSMDGLW